MIVGSITMHCSEKRAHTPPPKQSLVRKELVLNLVGLRAVLLFSSDHARKATAKLCKLKSERGAIGTVSRGSRLSRSLDPSRYDLSRATELRKRKRLLRCSHLVERVQKLSPGCTACMCPSLADVAVLLSLTLITDNDISEIQGLSNCHRLSHLSLMSNKIARIANLDNLPLKSLNLVSSSFGILDLC